MLDTNERQVQMIQRVANQESNFADIYLFHKKHNVVYACHDGKILSATKEVEEVIVNE